MSSEEIKRQIDRLKTVKGNVKLVQKKMQLLHCSAKAAGKIHQWRADEVQEIIDKMMRSVDEEVTNLNKMICQENATA
jgi:hypothetical protein